MSLFPVVWNLVIHLCVAYTAWTSKEHGLGSLDEMRSQNICLTSSHHQWDHSTCLCSAIFVHRCITISSVPLRRSTFFRFQLCDVTPVINCIFKSKETGLSVMRRSNLCCHLLNHMGCCCWGPLLIATESCWFHQLWSLTMSKSSSTAMACHWALYTRSNAPLPLEEGQQRPSGKGLAKASSRLQALFSSVFPLLANSQSVQSLVCKLYLYIPLEPWQRI